MLCAMVTSHEATQILDGCTAIALMAAGRPMVPPATRGTVQLVVPASAGLGYRRMPRRGWRQLCSVC
jgi:hypothetical protein